MPGRSLRSSPQWQLSPNNSILSTTFIASWRGQLLICTVCLALGIVYYYVHRPVSAILRSRREAVSRAMQAELMSQEKDGKDGDQSSTAVDRSKDTASMGKGKDKRKDLKKRKGSLLKVNLPAGSGSGATSATESNFSAAGPSSREPSPAPARLSVPTPTPKGKSKSVHGGSRRDRSVSPSSPSPSPSPRPQIRIRQPTSEDANRLPTIPSSGESPITPTSRADSDTSGQDATRGKSGQQETYAHGIHSNRGVEDPVLIPLPPSPRLEAEAGPSRRSKPASSNGDLSDSTTYSSSAVSGAPATSNGQSKAKSRQPPAWQSDGFSIVPDASYLPPSTVASVMHKRKKKRDRQTNLPDIFDTNPAHSSDSLSRYSQPTSVDNDSVTTPSSPPSRPAFRSHTRKASLKIIRPPADASPADLEEYFNERDQVVDSLRAEVGEAKAQEARAREAEQRAKDAEGRARRELDQANRRAAGNAEEQNRIILETLKAYEDLYTKTAGMREAAAQWAEVRRAREGPTAPDTQIPPMPQYHPHIVEMMGRQGPIANGVWVNPSPAPSPAQTPMTPNHNIRPAMPMTASFQSPVPHQNGLHPSHPPFPSSPGPRSNGFLSPAHGPPPFMGHPYIGPTAGPHFLPPGSHPSTPQPFAPHQHPGMFPLPPHHGAVPNGIVHDNLFIPNNGYRRMSDGSSFAGPLTPGLPSSASSPLPVHIGLGFPVSASVQGNGHRMQQGSSGESMSAERRVSIEATVMKKKSAANGGSLSTEAPSITEEIDGVDQTNPGLGLGDVEADVVNVSAGPTSASASSFDPSSSPELGGATSMSHSSSKSCPSSPDPSSSLELGKADIENHSEAITSAYAEHDDVADVKMPNTQPVVPITSVEGLSQPGEMRGNHQPDESFMPYFGTLACSREENERIQQGLKVETA